ncbi:uncharacterized protein V6R79_003158 [Siganus canaliculatus]
MKGYGRPFYGAGPGVGMGVPRGLGVPQLAKNQRTPGHGGNGYNGHGSQPMGGNTGSYGSAGLGLGPRFRNGGMKGPQPGYGGAGGVPNGQGAKPNGYGNNGNNPNGYGAKPNGYGNGAVPNGYGAKPNGYGAKPNGYGPVAGAGAGVPKGYGAKPNGYGGPETTKGVGAVSPSQGAKAPGTGYGMMPNGKGTKGAGAVNGNGNGLKGGALSPEQPSAAPELPVTPEPAITQDEIPAAPEPTSGILVMVTQQKSQKLPPPVTQEKSYKQTPLIPLATPEPVPVVPQGKDPVPVPEAAPEPVTVDLQAPTSGPVSPVSETNQAPEPAEDLDQGKGGGASKGQGSKPAKPDCGPSGVPNGQWMKIPRPGSNGGASSGTNTKGIGAGVPNGYGAKPNGYGPSAGGLSNGGGAKAKKPGYGPGGYNVPGLSNGYGAGLGYPSAGKPQQPAYGQGAYLGAGYGNGNSYGGNAGKSGYGNGNGYGGGVQPDYASLSQGGPAANGKSGGPKQVPYNGAPVVPAGLDGMNPFEPQSVGLGQNGKLGGMYGGAGGLPFGGQPLGMGAEKPQTKYGIGGLQFGGQPLNTGAGNYGYGGSPYGPAGDGKSSGKYGGLGGGMGGDPAAAKYGYGGFPNGGQLLGFGGNGNAPGKYAYGRNLYEAQPAGLGPEAKSAGKYGQASSQYQPEPLGLAQSGKVTGGYGSEVPYAPQPVAYGSEAKSSGKYENQGPYQSQPVESASQVKGEVPTPAAAVESEDLGAYENVGYINGQVQPEVVAFPAAMTPSPALADPSLPPYLPVDSSFTAEAMPGAGVKDLPDPAGTASLALDSAPASETQGVSEQSDDLNQQQMPRQIHIQQHLKLHFHHQGKSWRSLRAKNGKYDLNGFFGNSGYQGPRLLEFAKTPSHLQFNKYVLTGYRPVSTAQECLRSLFYMHNELGNIYTHGIPFFLFLVLLPFSIPWMEVDSVWICVVHYLACLSPTIGSVVYHVFMNHIGGEHVYDTLLSLDMFGVCLVNTLGALPIIHITLLCYPTIRRVALLAYILLSAYGIYCATTARTNVLRLRAFVWQGLFRFSLFLFRVYGSGVGSPSSLRLFVIMDSLAVLGGLVNIIQIPERFSPGLFDNWGNSHQIMHVMVICAIIYLHWGTLEDLAWIKTYQCPTE